MNTINALVIGDLHFKNDNATEMRDVSQRLLRIAQDKQPNFIVVLGDTLDQKDRIFLTPLCLSVELLKLLQDIAPLYLIIGNHDRRNDKIFLTDEHPFTALKYWNNTFVIDKITHIALDGKDFIFVPYVEPGRFIEALNTHAFDWQKADVIFCHQEFKDAQMGLVVSIRGDKWDLGWPYVISGHIHEYQKLQNNILYMGTPLQHRHCDAMDKYIGYFTFVDKINDHKDLKVELISLGLLAKKIICLNANDVNKFKLPVDCNPQLVISGTDTEIKTLLKHPKLDKWRKEGIKIVYKQTGFQKRTASEQPIDTQLSFSTLLLSEINKDQELVALYRDVLLLN